VALNHNFAESAFELISTLTTDASGNAVFKDLPYSYYTLVATKDDFEVGTARIIHAPLKTALNNT
jgi:hypothetical protein